MDGVNVPRYNLNIVSVRSNMKRIKYYISFKLLINQQSHTNNKYFKINELGTFFKELKGKKIKNKRNPPHPVNHRVM